MNKYIIKLTHLIIIVFLVILSPSAYAGGDNEQEEQCVKMTYAHATFFPVNELAYIFYRVHECLFSALKVDILFVNDDKSIDLTILRNTTSRCSDGGNLTVKYASCPDCQEVRISSRNIQKADYHDFILMVWIIQEYSRNEQDELDFHKIRHITENGVLKNLYTLIVNELNVQNILQSNNGIVASYWKIRKVHNFGECRVSRPGGTRFPDFKILKSDGNEYLMLFASIQGFKAEYISFCKELSIDESREYWTQKILTKQESKNLTEKEEGYLFEEFYFPRCYKLKVPSSYVYDPDVFFDWPGFRYGDF